MHVMTPVCKRIKILFRKQFSLYHYNCNLEGNSWVFDVFALKINKKIAIQPLNAHNPQQLFQPEILQHDSSYENRLELVQEKSCNVQNRLKL